MTVIDLTGQEQREIVPGYLARFVHSKGMTVAFWEVTAGAELPEHSHPHQQIAVVLEGEFEITLDGETTILRPGVTAVIPGGMPHSGRALSDCRLLDAFHPVREEYR